MTEFRLGPKSNPAELLAALGKKAATYQDRDYLYLPRYKRLVPHQTAARDYVCSCGSRLITVNADGRWLTVCAFDSAHGQDRFMTESAYGRMQHDEWVQKDLAEEAARRQAA